MRTGTSFVSLFPRNCCTNSNPSWGGVFSSTIISARLRLPEGPNQPTQPYLELKDVIKRQKGLLHLAAMRGILGDDKDHVLVVGSMLQVTAGIVTGQCHSPVKAIILPDVF